MPHECPPGSSPAGIQCRQRVVRANPVRLLSAPGRHRGSVRRPPGPLGISPAFRPAGEPLRGPLRAARPPRVVRRTRAGIRSFTEGGIDLGTSYAATSVCRSGSGRGRGSTTAAARCPQRQPQLRRHLPRFNGLVAQSRRLVSSHTGRPASSCSCLGAVTAARVLDGRRRPNPARAGRSGGGALLREVFRMRVDRRRRPLSTAKLLSPLVAR
jgi:hypothetical protein